MIFLDVPCPPLRFHNNSSSIDCLSLGAPGNQRPNQNPPTELTTRKEGKLGFRSLATGFASRRHDPRIPKVGRRLCNNFPTNLPQGLQEVGSMNFCKTLLHLPLLFHWESLALVPLSLAWRSTSKPRGSRSPCGHIITTAHLKR